MLPNIASKFFLDHPVYYLTIATNIWTHDYCNKNSEIYPAIATNVVSCHND